MSSSLNLRKPLPTKRASYRRLQKNCFNADSRKNAIFPIFLFKKTMRIPAAALAVLLIAIYPACTSAQNAAHLLTPDATRNTLEFLSSDEMKGRAVFSPEIDKAAGMIAASFKKSGLQPLQGNSFLQPFSVTVPHSRDCRPPLMERNFPKTILS